MSIPHRVKPGAESSLEERLQRVEDQSAIRDLTARYIAQLNAAGIFATPLVTTLEPLERFYPAEEYHQNYAARNPANAGITSNQDAAFQGHPRRAAMRSDAVDRSHTWSPSISTRLRVASRVRPCLASASTACGH